MAHRNIHTHFAYSPSSRGTKCPETRKHLRKNAKNGATPVSPAGVFVSNYPLTAVSASVVEGHVPKKIATPEPAASLVVAAPVAPSVEGDCDFQVLMIKRSSHGFFGSLTVFPGTWSREITRTSLISCDSQFDNPRSCVP